MNTTELLEALFNNEVAKVKRRTRIYGMVGIVGALAYITTIHPLIQQLNWKILQPTQQRIEKAKDAIAPEIEGVPEKGDTIAGYRVSSGYGYREKPCPQCSSFHPAIDLATPKGTPLFLAIPSDQSATVKCWRDSKGGGLVGEYTVSQTVRQHLHLSACKGGKRRGGQIFGQTGDSGIGTGAHLDIRLKPREQKPTTGLIYWTLKGSPMRPPIYRGGKK